MSLRVIGPPLPADASTPEQRPATRAAAPESSPTAAADSSPQAAREGAPEPAAGGSHNASARSSPIAAAVSSPEVGAASSPNVSERSSPQAAAASSPIAAARLWPRASARGAPSRRRVISGSLVPALGLALFFGLPLVGLLARTAAASALLDALRRPIVFEALRLSLLTSLIVLLLALLLGSPLALVLARQRWRGIGLLDSLVDLPIVLPPAVAGLALLLTFGRRGLLGTPLAAAGIELPFTTAAVIVASFFVAAPFYVRAARSGFLSVPREFEEAARGEGAS